MSSQAAFARLALAMKKAIKRRAEGTIEAIADALLFAVTNLLSMQTILTPTTQLNQCRTVETS
jgi:hypothetical protein